MIKDIFNSINGLGLWGTLAIILFIFVFCWWLFSALMLNSEHVEHMSSLPLESDNNDGERFNG